MINLDQILDELEKMLYLVTVVHYEDKDVEHNWNVFLAGHYIGQLHDCDGIGGHLGGFTETDLFEKACTLAQEDLRKRKQTRK